MARLNKQILGESEGPLGNVSISKRKGTTLVKSKPDRKKRKKGDPLPDQNRKLPLMSKLMKKFKDMINIGFDKKKKRDWTPVNAAVRYNLERAIIGESPDFDVDYSKISISRGKLETAWSGTLTYTAHMITASWEIPDCVKLKLVAKDKAYLLFYNTTTKKTVQVHGMVERQALSFAEDVKFFGNKGIMHAWIFFASPDGKEVSNSDYLGAVNLG